MFYISVCFFAILLSAIAGLVVGFLRPARRGKKKLLIGFCIGVGGRYLANYGGAFFDLSPQQVLMLFTPFGAGGMFSLLWGIVSHCRVPKNLRKATTGAQRGEPSTASPDSGLLLEQPMDGKIVAPRLSRLKQTEPFKTFISHTRHRGSTWIWLSISLLSGIWLIAWLSIALTPVKKLEEMNTLQGIFLKRTKPRKSNGFIHVRDSKGRIVRFSYTLPKTTPETLKTLRGKKVTIYYQYEFVIPILRFIREAREIALDGKLIDGYDYDTRLEDRASVRRQTIYLALVMLLPLLRVWWVTRKTQRLLSRNRKGEK